MEKLAQASFDSKLLAQREEKTTQAEDEDDDDDNPLPNTLTTLLATTICTFPQVP